MDPEALSNYIGSGEFQQASKNATRLVAKLRFINAKDKLIALQNLLFFGSCFLLDLKEYISGQDIALLFLESTAKLLQNHQDENGDEAKLQLYNPSLIYHSNRQTLSYEICIKTSQLIVRLPDTEIGQQKFVAEMLRILNPKILNRSLLHNVVAEESWKHKDYVNARYHYLHCASLENAQDIAKLLVEYQTSCASKSEIDLFITQFTLQFLCLQCPLDTPKAFNQKNSSRSPSVSVSRKTRSTIKSEAEKVFSNYVINHPLLSQTFEMLRNIYKVTWIRDPNYQGYLTRIGSLYFGIIDPAKQRQNSGGLFNNILQSLLDGTDENEDDSNQDSNSFSSSEELD